MGHGKQWRFKPQHLSEVRSRKLRYSPATQLDFIGINTGTHLQHPVIPGALDWHWVQKAQEQPDLDVKVTQTGVRRSQELEYRIKTISQ